VWNNMRACRVRARGGAPDDPGVPLSDVTEAFRSAAGHLQVGEVADAEAALWPGAKERPVAVPADVRRVLDMGEEEEAAARGPPSPKVQLRCFSFTDEDFANGNMLRWMSGTLVAMDYCPSEDGESVGSGEERGEGEEDDEEEVVGEEEDVAAAAA